MDTKFCGGCRQQLPADIYHFNERSDKSDGLQPWCRECNRDASKQYYRRNKSSHKKVVSRSKKRNLDEIRSRIIAYLQSHPCVDCPETDIVTLDFDHREPEQKTTSISRAVSLGWSWSRLEAEIEKCDVRCSNCHRKRTAKQVRSYKLLYKERKRQEFLNRLLTAQV